MKYIRTKDGVYEVEWNEDGSCWCLNNGGAYFRKEDIIAQADTIEELCDEFVIIERYGEKRYFHRDKKSFIKDYIGDKHIDMVLRYYTIYGAIWTDKGLIYVAKMNKDGELRLIC